MQVALNINIVLDSEKENVGRVQELLAGLAGASVSTDGTSLVVITKDPAVIAHISPEGVTSLGTAPVSLTDNKVDAGAHGALDASTTRPQAVVNTPAPTSAKHRAQRKLRENQAAVVSQDPAQIDALATVGAVPAVVYTRKEIEDAVTNLARKKSTEAAISMVSSFGVARISELTEAQYPDIMAKIAKELA